ncbi:MAG: type II secretion system protein GspM [Burkholderiaceae bacterium]
MSALPPPAGAFASATRLWAQRSPRERQAIRLAAATLAVLLVWLLAVQPAWRTLRETPPQLDRLDAELAQMQRIAAESRELRGATPVSTAQAAAAVQSAAAALGPAGRVTLQGERATLTVTDVGAPALLAWLAEVRGAARARPVEAQLSRAGNGYSGSVVLQLPGAGAAP